MMPGPSGFLTLERFSMKSHMRLFSVAVAVAALSGLMASTVAAQPVDPAPAYRATTAAADTRAQSVQTVSASEQTAGAVYLVADAAVYKPAHGGYPGVVVLREWKSRNFGGAFDVPMRGQPGYRT